MTCVLSVRAIARHDVHFVRELGEGAFGRVFLGLCKGLQPDEEHTMVAVKTIKVRLAYLHERMNLILR